MERRRLLKGLGVVAGAAGAGGIGIMSSSASAAATAGTDLNDTSVTSNDGSVEYVAVQATGRMKWDGFDTPVGQARIINKVQYWRNGSMLNEYQIHDTGAFTDGFDGSSWGGSGEAVSLSDEGREGYIASDIDWGIAQEDRQNTYDNGYPLPENPAPTAPLDNGTDGSEKKTKVVLVAEYRLYDASGNELTGTTGYPDRPVSKASTILTVTNEEATTSFGDADAEGDTEDSASAA